MPERTIEDRLREQYFDLLPEIRRVALELEAEIRFRTLPILRDLRTHEQLIVKSRVKDCESALKRVVRLRGQSDLAPGEDPGGEGRVFDPERADDYSLLNLPDLAGVRILAFPNRRVAEIDELLRRHFANWTYKPVKDDSGSVLAPKYFGYCADASNRVRGEYQVVPMLLGLFWEVEHAAMYKLRAVARSKVMRGHRTNVEQALAAFESGIESFLRNNPQ